MDFGNHLPIDKVVLARQLCLMIEHLVRFSRVPTFENKLILRFVFFRNIVFFVQVTTKVVFL